MILHRFLAASGSLALFGVAAADSSGPRTEPQDNIAGRDEFDTLSNGSSVIWVIEDTYQGQSFFDTFTFFTDPDPTNGLVTYVDRDTAFSTGLAYVQSDGKVIMKGDDTTQLPYGTNRSSVRISSNATYNGGLFILDLDRAPWGCGVWPAWWTVGNGSWPWTGEIDIIEGVHANEHNQVTWHTAPGCNLTNVNSFSGEVVQTNGQDNLQCNALINDNAGCGVVEWSQSSYGPYFDSIGGGVFTMKWDSDGIAVWSFYRSAVPSDIVNGEPDPSNWGTPVAALSPTQCNLTQYFVDHSIIFDITFCGDWAGNSYATSGCPGTCEDQLMAGSNFVNASWIINSLKVYKEAVMYGSNTGSAPSIRSRSKHNWLWSLITVVVLLEMAIII